MIRVTIEIEGEVTVELEEPRVSYATSAVQAQIAALAAKATRKAQATVGA